VSKRKSDETTDPAGATVSEDAPETEDADSIKPKPEPDPDLVETWVEAPSDATYAEPEPEESSEDGDDAEPTTGAAGERGRRDDGDAEPEDAPAS
jgi:hypothetical protein